MTIICTEEERREMEILIAIAHDCLCSSPDYFSDPKCNRCIKNKIQWTIKDGNKEFSAHETVIGKALDAGHIYR